MAANLGADYKARKEAFVSNLSGGTITEINVVSLVVPAALLLWTVLQRSQSFFTPYTPLAFAVDFLLNVCAILFAFTIYSSTPLALSIFLATPALLLILLQQPKDGSNNSTTKSKAKKLSTAASSPTTNRLVSRPFLTHYRGTMMVMTILAILAVDFPIFPRRFAKVETWGTSLMDIGVGSFVFAAGLVSSRDLFKSNTFQPSLPTRMLTSLRHSLPLLVLGIIRLLSVKGVDYAEHVTEYGVHWNFFFTLGCLPPFVALADALPITRTYPASYAIIALCISLAYEFTLNLTPLLSYILISPRDPSSLLSQNREGIFSFLGYLAIYLKGRSTGHSLVQYIPPSSSTSSSKSSASPKPGPINGFTATRRERPRLLRALAIDTLINTTIYLLSTSVFVFNLSVSRRLANLPYVFWVCAFNTANLAVFAVIESLGPEISYEDSTEAGKEGLRQATSKVLAVFNSNGLVVFLVANLLTGAVNLGVDTLGMGGWGSMGVLVGYAAVVTGVAVGVDRSGVKIRL